MSRRCEPESTDRLLGQICRLHHSRAHALLEEMGLYRGQPPMLRALWEREGRTHSELAAYLHVRPATITKMIQRMERAGFVERKHDSEDERVSRVYLTEVGRAVKADVRQAMCALEEETLVGFDSEQRAMLRRFLLQIRDNLMQANEDRLPCKCHHMGHKVENDDLMEKDQ